MSLLFNQVFKIYDLWNHFGQLKAGWTSLGHRNHKKVWLRTPERPPCSNPAYHGQRYFPIDQVAWSPFQSGLEHLIPWVRHP